MGEVGPEPAGPRMTRLALWSCLFALGAPLVCLLVAAVAWLLE